jgi:serine/threonine-protein kinase RsbW
VSLHEEIAAPQTLEGIMTVLDTLDEALKRERVPEITGSEVHLAVEEAVVNIMSYSHGKSMTIAFHIDRNSIVVAILDDGIPFDPLQVSAPDLDKPIDERIPGGLGIFLIRKSMNTVSYEYKDGKNILRMEKRFS